LGPFNIKRLPWIKIRSSVCTDSKVGRADKMIKSGRFEDLYRQLKAVPSSARSEYFMMEAGRKVGPQEIEDVAKQLGVFDPQ
jgi:hypothetical protein